MEETMKFDSHNSMNDSYLTTSEIESFEWILEAHFILIGNLRDFKQAIQEQKWKRSWRVGPINKNYKLF